MLLRQKKNEEVKYATRWFDTAGMSACQLKIKYIVLNRIPKKKKKKKIHKAIPFYTLREETKIPCMFGNNVSWT
jgi:hypothetical protein